MRAHSKTLQKTCRASRLWLSSCVSSLIGTAGVQDVVQPGPLAATLGGQMMSDPLFVPQILAHVGPLPLADWAVHFVALVWYRALHAAAAPAVREAAKKLPPRQRYVLHRWLDAWKYGSGQDYRL